MIDKQSELEKKIFRLQASCVIMVMIGGVVFDDDHFEDWNNQTAWLEDSVPQFVLTIILP